MKKRMIAMLVAVVMLCLEVAGFTPTTEVEAAYSVTEEDIFYKCPEYLDNTAYDNYMTRCEERIAKGMATINDSEEIGASILYALQNGSDIILAELASLAGLGESTRSKMNKEVVYEIVQAYLSSDTSATDTVSQIGNAYSTISDAYDVASATDLYNYKESLKTSSRNLSSSQIDELVDMYTDADTFSKILGHAGNAQKALQVITAYIEMQDLDLTVLYKLDDTFSSMDSDFASGIQAIINDRNSDFLTYAKNNYLQDAIIKKMVGAVAKYASSPVLLVKDISVNVLGKVYESFCPTADKIIHAGMCQAYTYLARNKVNNLRKDFKNGNVTEDKIEQYKVAYGFYITTMKTTMYKVASCVNGSEKAIKDALKSWASSLSGFTYTSYIERCQSAASSDVAAGLLKISGDTVTRKTDDGTTIDENYDSTESVKARLATIKQKFPPNQGMTWTSDWGGAIQCFGFARMVFYLLYGKEMPANYYSNARYQYKNENGVNMVGQLTGNFTAAQVQALFAQAKIGDIIQASTTASSGQHTMVFTGLTANGITVYDCNAAVNGCAVGGCGINEWERSYSELATGTYGYGSSNGGITIYRADNYASIYGDGDDVFYDDSANFIIEDGVLIEYTGWQPFVEIPDTVTAIGDEAFLNNKTMMHVLIPDSVTSIGASAFKGCTSLLSVTIPDSVESVGDSAFYGCSSLGYAKLPENVKYLTVNDSLFKYCTSLKEIVIPEYVTKIANQAFYSCSALSKVELNPYVATIGIEAFYGCKVENIELPKTCESLASDAFGKCEELQSVYINKRLTNTSGGLWDSAGPFNECTSLNHVIFEEGIVEIPTSLFAGCTGLRSIELPETITSISGYAFQDCTNLTNIEFPRAIKTIGQRAFEDCDSLVKIDFNKVEYVGGYAFSNCDNIANVYIPDTLKETGYSYWDMKDGGVFAGCSKLSEIDFAETVTEIPDNMFRSIEVTKIDLPRDLEKIGSYAFYDADNLKEITWNGTVNEIGEYAFSRCGEVEKIEVPNTVEVMGDYVFAGSTNLSEVHLPDGRVNITKGMFDGCTSLTTVNIPDTVTTINTYAFQNCSSLKEIVFPEKLQYIYQYAFSGCSSLGRVMLPHTTTLLSARAFENCEMLSEVILGAALKEIPDQTFTGCSSLESIILPYQVESIGDDAFKNCVKLNKITIPKATTEISDSAFSYPDKVTIYGVAGSYAEQYAIENDIAFVAQEIPTEEVTLTETELTLAKNKTYQLVAALNPMDSTDDVTWSTSDEAIVSVDESGEIRALATGEATITATAGNKTATCKVIVNIPMTSISLNKSSLELQSIGDTYQLTGYRYPSDSEGTILWKSDDTSIVSVDEEGKVTAVAAGETVITAYCGDLSATCTVVSKGEIADDSELEPTPAPTSTPTPTVTPTPTQTPPTDDEDDDADNPSATQTPAPTQTPSAGGSGIGGIIPTATPTASPSVSPDGTGKTAENNNDNTASDISSDDSQTEVSQVATLGKVKLSSAKNKKKNKAVLKWKKLSGAIGYQIQYGTNKKFKKAKVKTTGKTKYTLKKLKKKKTYYIRVRAYQVANGVKVYGKWSGVKKVKIRK